MKFDLTNIDSSLVGHLDILKRFFTSLGTKEYRYDDFAEEVSLNMANYSFSVNYQPEAGNKDGINAYACLTVSCLNSKLGNAFELLEEVLTSVDFGDKERLT